MISEKITELRKGRGWSQEQLAEQLGISRQSVSKWESGMAVPDLDRIIKISDLFGVSVDYLVKDEVTVGKQADTYSEYQEYYEAEPISTSKQYYTNENTAAGGRVVSMQEAENYMNLVEQTSKKIALGVTMCIISPVLLILLCGLADGSYLGINERLAAGVGVIALLCIITVAVSFFVLNGMKLQKYEYIETEKVVIDEPTRAAVEKRKVGYEPKFREGIAFGVIICIVSVIPLVGNACLLPATDSGIENGSNGLLIILSVGLLLIMVSVGVNILVRVSSVWGSYQKLLQEGDYTEAMKEENNAIDIWAGIYWCIVTAVYLVISFTGILGWGRSWIVWPVAGVAFGAVCGIIKVVSAKRR